MDLRCEGNRLGVTVRDVPADAFVQAYAKHLKDSGEFEVPKFMDYAKSGASRQLAPMDPDFLYIRAASIVRRLVFRPVGGVGTLRRVYGKSQNNGVAPSHHRDAGGKIIRHCLQQLQKMGILHTLENKGYRGLTPKGYSTADQVAKNCN